MLKVCRTEGSPHTYFMLTMSLTESNGDLRFLKKFGVSAWAGSPEKYGSRHGLAEETLLRRTDITYVDVHGTAHVFGRGPQPDGIRIGLERPYPFAFAKSECVDVDGKLLPSAGNETGSQRIVHRGAGYRQHEGRQEGRRCGEVSLIVKALHRISGNCRDSRWHPKAAREEALFPFLPVLPLSAERDARYA